MLDLAVKKGVRPWIEMLPSYVLFHSLLCLTSLFASLTFPTVKDCGQAVQAVKDGKAHYRHVLK